VNAATLAEQLAGMNLLEVVAVALAIAYLLLAVRESLWCWPAAFLSTSIYLYLFFDARLYMESALQVFYLVMAVYGWYVWHKGAGGDRQLPVSRWPARVHVLAILLILALSAGSGFLLHRHTLAAFPYLDSFTTWAAVWTTYLVARKKLENWIYWMIIDSLSVYLYLQRELDLTALLFIMYVVISVFGFLSWKRSWREPAGAVPG
jgi:nicotinamide mononucleotide transporter